jgi:arginyl-tRNA synthetase
MLRPQVAAILRQCFETAFPAHQLGDTCYQNALADFIALPIERPRLATHGDFSINVSALARHLKQPPTTIAQQLVAASPANSSILAATLEAVGGFVNVRLAAHTLANALFAVLAAPQPGRSQQLAQQRVLLEFVSANPTGPLHVGHGRWAALGDSLRRILQHAGAQVFTEFYINDAGVQIINLANSLWWRCFECCFPEAPQKFPEKQEAQPYPYYPGEYLVAMAEALLAEDNLRARFIAAWQADPQTPETCPFGLRPGSPMTSIWQQLSAAGPARLLAQQQALLSAFGCVFDAYFSERAGIHASGLLDETLTLLKARAPEVVFEADGALWFRSTAYGDDKDRVLKKSDGQDTYLTADIAYHHQKFSRRGSDAAPAFNVLLNIWGADHHGYVARLRGAMAALGHPAQQFEVLLGQLVNLIVSGERTRMGKRRGMLTLADVVEDVGVDAARFWMVWRSADVTLDFDLDLAARASDDNPVFYAQYAHARCAGIVRHAGDVLPAHATDDDPQAWPPETQTHHLWTPLEEDGPALATLKALILKLDHFEDLVADAGRLRAPHMLARYVLELAADFHSFYNACRVITPDDVEQSLARLAVVRATQRVLAQALALLGVHAPETM